MARRGTFGSSTAPFGGGAPFTDLSVYNIGGTQSTGGGYYYPSGSWYNPAPAPIKPTVAPPAAAFYGTLVLPVPTLPDVMLPGVQYTPEPTGFIAYPSENQSSGWG